MSLLSGLVIGVILAELRAGGEITDYHDGVLLARGALTRALSEQIGGSAAGAKIQVTGTYRGRSGEYCRTFSVGGPQVLSGLACHKRGQWQVQALLTAAAGSADFNKVVTGAPLSTAIETQLRARNWQ